MAGYNENFESYVSDGTTYDTYYIKFNEYDRSAYVWGDYIHEDSTVILAVPQAGNNLSPDFQNILEEALGEVFENNICITTTSTTTAPPPVPA